MGCVMGLFRFTGSQPQVYMDRSLEVAPGDEVQWAEPPADGLWEQVGGAPDPAGAGDDAQSAKKTNRRRAADPSGE